MRSSGPKVGWSNSHELSEATGHSKDFKSQGHASPLFDANLQSSKSKNFNSQASEDSGHSKDFNSQVTASPVLYDALSDEVFIAVLAANVTSQMKDYNSQELCKHDLEYVILSKKDSILKSWQILLRDPEPSNEKISILKTLRRFIVAQLVPQ
eukprot:10615452-Karenia_brevis.AAC.1